MKKYPNWVCGKCGKKYGKQMEAWQVATFHAGKCEVCGEKTFITEPRDYGYPDFPGYEQKESIITEEQNELYAAAVRKEVMKESKREAHENFYNALKDNQEEIIKWCEDQIEEYKKLIKLIKKK